MFGDAVVVLKLSNYRRRHCRRRRRRRRRLKANSSVKIVLSVVVIDSKVFIFADTKAETFFNEYFLWESVEIFLVRIRFWIGFVDEKKILTLRKKESLKQFN